MCGEDMVIEPALYRGVLGHDNGFALLLENTKASQATDGREIISSEICAVLGKLHTSIGVAVWASPQNLSFSGEWSGQMAHVRRERYTFSLRDKRVIQSTFGPERNDSYPTTSWSRQGGGRSYIGPKGHYSMSGTLTEC